MEPRNAQKADALVACRFCGSNNLRAFKQNRRDEVIGNRVDIEMIQCGDCTAEAPKSIWNSTPDTFKLPDFTLKKLTSKRE